MTYVYLEMPNWLKITENELESRLDQWLYFIKNIRDFQSIPIIFKDEVIFENAFEQAELANLDIVQWESYERSLKEFRNLKEMFEYASQSAFDDGKLEVAKSLKESGVATAIITKTKGLSKEQEDNLQFQY